MRPINPNPSLKKPKLKTAIVTIWTMEHILQISTRW